MSLRKLGHQLRPVPPGTSADAAHLGSRAESAMLSATSAAPGGRAGPFQGPDLWARVIPFAFVAVLAEASLALPPQPTSWAEVLASVLLLLLTAAAFFLPWSRLPQWATVLVPLIYTGSVLALVLAAGSTNGVGIVILIPLVWTALFHRRWESAVVVAAIVAVEVTISLMPVAAPDVILRRAIFWASLGALISIATHGLRDRIRRSRQRSAELQDRLRELTVLADRDRIAAGLRDTVIQRIFAAGLALQSAASQTSEREVRRKIGTSVAELDQTVRVLRDAIFGLEQRSEDRSLRQEVTRLCAVLSPAPEISFSGPVDTGLSARSRERLLGMLAEALNPISKSDVPARIGIDVGEDSCRAVIEAGPVPGADALDEVNGSDGKFSGLLSQATANGIRIDIGVIPGGTRVAWQVPLNSPASNSPASPLGSADGGRPGA